jgi:hypothetical protein
MPENFPGPYELRFNYDTNETFGTDQHQFRLSLDLDVVGEPGEAFTEFEATRRNTTPIALNTLAEATLSVIVDVFKTDANFPSVELWEYEPSSFVANYITSYNVVTNNAGTHASTPQPYRQDVWTFRTTNGGTAKLDLRGTVSTSLARVAYPTGNALIDDIFEYLAQATTPYLGRDNGYLFFSQNWLGGSNESRFKKVNR